MTIEGGGERLQWHFENRILWNPDWQWSYYLRPSVAYVISKSGYDEAYAITDSPKGLVRYGPNERRKVRLHVEIKEVDEQVRCDDPKLRLHAYVLSVTAPDEIGDELRSREEWEDHGVYFLGDDTWPERHLGHGLTSVSFEQ